MWRWCPRGVCGDGALGVCGSGALGVCVEMVPQGDVEMVPRGGGGGGVEGKSVVWTMFMISLLPRTSILLWRRLLFRITFRFHMPFWNMSNGIHTVPKC